MGLRSISAVFPAIIVFIATVANADDFKTTDPLVTRFLTDHCVKCHGTDRAEKKLRLDQAGHDLTRPANLELWQRVLKRVRSGEMPPDGEPKPDAAVAKAVVDRLTRRLGQAEAAQRADGRVVMRRLNRVEYENTIRDLLGIVIDLQDLLPADSAADGFDNGAEALHTSSFLMERYLDAADQALALAIANRPQPPLVKKQLRFHDERQVKIATEKVYRKLDDSVVMFSSSAWNSVTVSQFYPPDRGLYRFRIRARGFQSAEKPVTYRIDAGPMLMGTRNHLVGYFDAAPENASVTEFTDHLEARSTIRISPYGLANAQTVDKIGAETYSGPGLAVEWVEVEGPLHETWPPECHRRLFGNLPQKKAPIYNQSDRVEVVSENPVADARQILTQFLGRAYRRAITNADVDPFVAIVESRLAEGYSFEQSVRVALKGVLVSPGFLFLREVPGRLDDEALASRLSYFLWSTMPDEELRQSAVTGQLHEPTVLAAQVERMLNHPKSKALTENFVGQWLKLRDLDFTEPDHLLYPEFDDLLKAAMLQESHRFFEEVIKQDLSLTNFVASDFSMLNERLARHYGIPGVEGHAIRKVMLPPDSHRGGVLTMASVLKVTANGTTTSPVVRGAWVLDRILGTPPQPPPDGVPAVEPDIRGATTIRDQLAKHRDVETCASCHRQIDPPGFALESFDVIGGWRDNYRSRGLGEPVTIDGRRMHYARGPKVNPSDTLQDGRSFANIDEYKQLLLADKDQLARSLATKLTTYATGRAPQSVDRDQIETIVGRVREKSYGFRRLIHEVVQSRLFLEK